MVNAYCASCSALEECVEVKRRGCEGGDQSGAAIGVAGRSALKRVRVPSYAMR